MIHVREVVLSKEKGLIRNKTYSIRIFEPHNLSALFEQAGFKQVVVQTGFTPNHNKEDRVHHSFARKRIIPFFVFLLIMAVISGNQSTAYADKTTQFFSFKIALAEKNARWPYG